MCALGKMQTKEVWRLGISYDFEMFISPKRDTVVLRLGTGSLKIFFFNLISVL